MVANKGKGKALGKGLGALFTDINMDDEKNFDIIFIDINKIAPNPNQPRRIFESAKIDELADSIKVHGIIQPIIVKSLDSGYEIIAGERRWRAARKAGLKDIPCIIKDIDDQHNMLMAIIENLQREDLNSLEEAKAFEHMIQLYHMTQEEVSKNVGKSRAYITNSLRLLKLPLEIQELLYNNKITTGHARALINIEDNKTQHQLAMEAANKGLSVRQIETAAHTKKTTKRRTTKNLKKDAQLLSIEDELKKALGTKVVVNHAGNKGKIEIEYYNQEELERLIEILMNN